MTKFIDLDNGAECLTFDNGTKHWYLNDQLHRTDGPAIECYNDTKYWFINGIPYTEEEFDMIKEVLWAV